MKYQIQKERAYTNVDFLGVQDVFQKVFKDPKKNTLNKAAC